MSSDDDDYIVPVRNRKNSEISGIKINFFSSENEIKRESIINTTSVRFSSLKKDEQVDDYRQSVTRSQFFSDSDSDSESKAKPRHRLFDSDSDKEETKNSSKIYNQILTSVRQTSTESQIDKKTPIPEMNRADDLLQKSSDVDSNQKYDFGSHLITAAKNNPHIIADTLLTSNINKSEPVINTTKTVIRENLNLKTTLSKTNAELKHLIDKYEDKPEFKDTIDRILLDKPFWFDLYRNKRDKISLLNEAVSSHDGNSILAVVLYIKRTLSKEIFYEILVSNSTAMNQYVFYLKQINDLEELAALEKYQKNPVEIATILNFYKVICDRSLDLNEKLRIFYDFERHLTLNEINLVKNSSVYQAASKHITLLKIQKEIYKNKSTFHRKQESKQDALDNLYESTVSDSLSFCIKYQKELSENALYSSDHFKKEFDINGKEYSIWFIKAMSETCQWTEIEKFLSQKTFFNMVQKEKNVRYETILSIVYYAKGPEEQLKKYLSQVEDIENRRLLAIKLKIYDIVIEAFKLQKDRIGLYNFRNTFKEDSFEYIKANIALKDDKV